ncbi:trichohyalin, putative [Entamoeba histolytica]
MEAVLFEQLEEWTNRKVGYKLFDSDKDDWDRNISIFKQRIMNKENIIIIIEYSKGNKFGGYANEKIDKYEMKKFDIKQPQYAFILFNQTLNCLFEFGYCDIRVYKENNKRNSCCKQQSFEYKGIENAFCGNERPNCFTPKRIIVIEMK